MFIMRMGIGGNIIGMERGDKKIKESVKNLRHNLFIDFWKS